MSAAAIVMCAGAGLFILGVIAGFAAVTHMDSGPEWLTGTAGSLAYFLMPGGAVTALIGLGMWIR